MMSKLYSPIVFLFALCIGYLAANQHSPQLEDLSSMGSTTPDEHFDRLKGKIKLIPEYAPAFGVVFGGTLFHTEEKGLIDELLAIYLQIQRTQPALKYYMMVSDRPDERYDNQSAIGFWKRRLPSEVTLVPISDAELTAHPAYNGNNEQMSPWIRDTGPITIQLDGRRTWLEFMPGTLDKIQPILDLAPIPLARALKIPVLSPDIYLHGGNFMVNSKGTCVFSEEINVRNDVEGEERDPVVIQQRVAKRLKRIMGCRDVIVLPWLPYEGTGHIDLYAKFVNDTTVLINKYEQEKLHKATIRRTLHCTRSSAWPPPTEFCRETESETEFVRDPDGKLALFEPKDIGMEMYEEDHPGSLLEHQKKVRKIFEAKGFKVIEVPTPQPVATIDVRTYHSYDQKKVHTETDLTMNHLSFMNTLLLNKYAYVPQYRALEGTPYNQVALDIFQKFGFKTYGLESDEIILKLGGGVHCATMQLN